MNLLGVAALEHDSHPDNKGPAHAPGACPKTHPIDHRYASNTT